MDTKKNIPLIVALSIPVSMIVLTAVSIYLPSMFAKPKIDFVYSSGGDYCNQNRYSVRNGKIIEIEIKKPPEPSSCPAAPQPRIFYYDVTRDVSREITLEEANRFFIEDTFQSRDGFEIVTGGGDGGFFFGGSSSYGNRYLKRGGFSKKLNLNGAGSTTYYNYYDYRFLGWIKGENHG